MNVLDVHPYETSWMPHLPDNDSDATAGRRDAQYLTVTNLAAHSKPALSLPKGPGFLKPIPSKYWCFAR